MGVNLAKNIMFLNANSGFLNPRVHPSDGDVNIKTLSDF
jgi:hypothetical protein